MKISLKDALLHLGVNSRSLSESGTSNSKFESTKVPESLSTFREFCPSEFLESNISTNIIKPKSEYRLDFAKYKEKLGGVISTKTITYAGLNSYLWMFIFDNFAFILHSSSNSYDMGRVLWTCRLFSRDSKVLSQYKLSDGEMKSILGSNTSSLMIGGFKFVKVNDSYTDLSQVVGKL